MATIITAAEVLQASPAGKGFPTDVICQQIAKIEPDFGYECLGETLYDWLLDNMAAVPADLKEWVQDSEYAEGDFVVRNGCLFESLTDCNRADPLDDPDELWQAFEKFGTNDCANEFWKGYLKPVLALKIYMASLNYATRQTGANGVTVLSGTSEFGGQGFRSANKNELSDYKTDLIADIERATRNMLRWAKKKIDSGDTCTVPLSEMLNCNGMCQPQTNSRRRWGFRR
jgi:hypothetical protein